MLERSPFFDLKLDREGHMHNPQNTCHAEVGGGESIEINFGVLGLQLRSRERSPSFDLEFNPEGQYAQPSKHLSGWIL